MQAKDALNQSERGLIMADTVSGLVIIRQQGVEQRSSEGRFLIQFVSHDTNGWHDGSGIQTVGQHENLDNAVAAATVNYGIAEKGWMPLNRYATAVLGPVLEQDRPVDISALVKSTRERELEQ